MMPLSLFWFPSLFFQQKIERKREVFSNASIMYFVWERKSFFLNDFELSEFLMVTNYIFKKVKKVHLCLNDCLNDDDVVVVLIVFRKITWKSSSLSSFLWILLFLFFLFLFDSPSLFLGFLNDFPQFFQNYFVLR